MNIMHRVLFATLYSMTGIFGSSVNNNAWSDTLTVPGPFYQYEVVAKEGEDNIEFIESRPAINDNGTIAFYAHTYDDLDFPLGSEFSLMVKRRNNDIDELGSTRGLFNRYLQINNENQIITSEGEKLTDSALAQSTGGEFLYQLWDADDAVPESSVFTPALSLWPPLPDFQAEPWRFDSLSLHPRLNNHGDIVFGASYGLNDSSDPTIAHELIIGMPSGRTFLDGFDRLVLDTQRPITKTYEIFPMIADDGRIVVRNGVDRNDPIVVYDTINDTTPHKISTLEFNELGIAPAISTDGKIVVFAGNKGNGPGIFLSVDAGRGFEDSIPIVGADHRIHGDNGELGYFQESGASIPIPLFFEELDLDQFLAVIHIENDLGNDTAIVAFMGKPNEASRALPGTSAPMLFSEQLGLWTVKIEFRRDPAESNRLIVQPSSPLPVAQVGDLIDGSQINKLLAYDPMAHVFLDEEGSARDHRGNIDHQIAFLADTNHGELIVKASQIDSDSDGLFDHWETDGIDMDGDGVIDLDLPALGADPLHKDIFLEIDWLVERNGNGNDAWSNELHPGVTSKLVETFLFAPVSNPDGIDGIKLHVDAGTEEDSEGVPYSWGIPAEFLRGGDEIGMPNSPNVHVDLVEFGRPARSLPPQMTVRHFQDIKEVYFGASDKRARELAFKYAVISDFYGFVFPNANREPFLSSVVTATARGLVSVTQLPLIKSGVIKILSGTGSGQHRRFIKIHPNEIEVDQRWSVQPDSSSLFVLMHPYAGVSEALADPFVNLSFPPSNDLMVTLGGLGRNGGMLGNTRLQWRTIAHELGHTLGLIHCGIKAEGEFCDNANVGIDVIKNGVAVVAEQSVTDTYEIALKTKPTAKVVVDIVDSMPLVSEVKITPSSVEFTPSNWGTPKEIKITAVDDFQVEPQYHETEIIHRINKSATRDPQYSHLTNVTRQKVRIYDYQTPSLIYIDMSNADQSFKVIEGHKVITYSPLLSSRPIANVAIEIQASPPLIATPSQVIYKPTNWFVPQLVTVRFPNDDEIENSSSILHEVSTTDPIYNNLLPAANMPLIFELIDNDVAAVLILESGDTTVVEGGNAVSYGIRLLKQPSATVTIDASVNEEQLNVETSPLIFSPGNWSEIQYVTFTAVDDDKAEGRHEQNVRHRVQSSDAEYEALTLDDVAVYITDNDFLPDPDHRSLMSYRHQAADLYGVNSYAGPGEPLYDEWSNLRYDFQRSFSGLGRTSGVGLGVSINEAVESTGKWSDVTSPIVDVLSPLSGTVVPVGSEINIEVDANDSESGIELVRLIFDLNGDEEIDVNERFTATRRSTSSFTLSLPSVSGLLGERRLRIFAYDRAGNYQINDVSVQIAEQASNTPPNSENQLIFVGIDNARAILLQATDENANALEYQIVEPPLNGILSGTIPSLYYTPDTGFTGTDTFSFIANDGLSDSNEATITMLVSAPQLPTNMSPIAYTDRIMVNKDSTGNTISVLNNDFDADGDSLVITDVGPPDQGGNAQVEDNRITYSPLSGFEGVERFTYTITDGRESASADVVVSVVDVSNWSSDTTWEWQNPRPQGNPLNSVSCPGSTFCIAVGKAGTVVTMFAAGEQPILWHVKTLESGVELRAIDCASNTDCIAVGDGGEIYHTRDAGDSWTAGFSGVEAMLTDVSCSSSTDCVASLQSFGGSSDSSTLIATADGGETWAFSSGDVGSHFKDIDCADNTCIGVGANGLIAKSVDRGRAWQVIALGVITELRAVSCATDSSCMVIDRNGIAYVSNDAAVSWSTMDGTPFHHRSPRVKNLNCITPNKCVAAREDSTRHNISITEDGGNTWQRYSSGGPGLISDLSCGDGEFCVAVNRFGLIYSSGNGGLSWINQVQPLSENLNDVICLDDMLCLTAGDSGMIQRSNDGGATWQQIPTSVSSIIKSLHCVSGSDCFAVGQGGTFLLTVDAGETWTQKQIGVDEDLYDVDCYSSVNCVIVGNNKLVITSDDAGMSWTDVGNNTPLTLENIDCPAEELCVAVQSRFRAPMLSEDGGHTWRFSQSSDVRNSEVLTDIDCVSVDHCLALTSVQGVLHSYDRGLSWEYSSTGANGKQADIDCSDDLNCFIVGDEWVRTTTDGGVTWASSNIPISRELRQIHCPTNSNCVAVGERGVTIVLDDSGGLRSANDSIIDYHLKRVSCPDAMTCFATSGTTRIAKTSDGGSSWATVYHETASTSTSLGYVGLGINDISCGTADHCVAVTNGYLGIGGLNGRPYEEAKILSTVDGGRTWESWDSGFTGNLTAVDCHSDQFCAVVGSPDKQFVTTDGGTTWTETGSGTQNRSWVDVQCNSTTSCVAVYDDGFGNGFIAVTQNSGILWKLEHFSFGSKFYGVSCATEFCVAAGEDGAIATSIDITNTWRNDNLDTPSDLNSVSCSSVDHCMAVGDAGLSVVSADGATTWDVLPATSSTTLNDVSCPSTNQCWTVGRDGHILVLER